MTEFRPLNFLLVEDDQFFLNHFESILEKSPFINLNKIFSVSSYDEFKEIISGEKVDICLTDMSLYQEKIGGKIAKECHNLGIISGIYSNYDEDDHEIEYYTKSGDILFFNKGKTPVDEAFLELCSHYISKKLIKAKNLELVKLIDPLFYLHKTNKFLKKNINLINLKKNEVDIIKDIASIYFDHYYLGSPVEEKERNQPYFFHFRSLEEKDNYYQKNQRLNLESLRAINILGGNRL